MLEKLGRRANQFKSPGNPKFIVQEITKLYTSGNSKRIEWEFLKVMTTLYNNRSILMCQNSDYIINE